MSLHDDLKAYLDGELDLERSEEVRLAMDRDPNLRKEFEQLRLLGASVKSCAANITPHGLEQTLAALERKRKPAFAIGRGWMLGGAFALATAVVFFAILPVFESAKVAAKNSLAFQSENATVASMAAEAKSVGGAPASPMADQMQAPSADAAKSAPLPKFAAKTDQPVLGADQNLSAKNIESTKKNLSKVPAVVTPRFPTTTNQAREQVNDKAPRDASTKRAPSVTSAATPNTQKFEPMMARRVSPKVSVVTLAFSSRDVGVAKVTDAIEKYRTPEMKSASRNRTIQSGDRSSTIEIEVDEDQADAVIESLRGLTSTVRLSGKSGAEMTNDASVKAGSGGAGRGGPGAGFEFYRERTLGVNLTPPSSKAASQAPRAKDPVYGNSPTANSEKTAAKSPKAQGGKQGVPELAKSSESAKPSADVVAPTGSSKSTFKDAMSHPGNAGTGKPGGKTRRILIVIQELPKKDPVP